MFLYRVKMFSNLTKNVFKKGKNVFIQGKNVLKVN